MNTHTKEARIVMAFLLIVLILAGAYVWKNSYSPIPPSSSTATTTPIVDDRQFGPEGSIPLDIPKSLIYTGSKSIENYVVPKDASRESTVLLETTKTFQSVVDFYKKELPKEGFVISSGQATSSTTEAILAENTKLGTKISLFIFSFKTQTETTTRISIRYEVNDLKK